MTDDVKKIRQKVGHARNDGDVAFPPPARHILVAVVLWLHHTPLHYIGSMVHAYDFSTAKEL